MPCIILVRQKWSHLSYLFKVRSILSAGCFVDFVTLPSLTFSCPQSKCAPPPFALPQRALIPFSVQQTKVLQSNISLFPFLFFMTTCCVFSLHYFSPSSFIKCSSLDFCSVAASSFFLIFKISRETNCTFWQCLIWEEI